MKSVALLIIMISNQGYWFGEQPGTIVFRRAVPGGLPGADLVWELSVGEVRLDAGKIALRAGDEATVLTITPPRVRVRTSLRWTWRLLERDTGKEAGNGEALIQAFPQTLLDDVAKRVGRKKLFVMDDDRQIPRLLDQAEVPYTRLRDLAPLQMAKADMVLIGPGQLSEGGFDQTPLIQQARTGASVFIFRQDKPRQVGGYRLVIRGLPAEMNWRLDHPLFSGLEPADVSSWLHDRQATAIQLPPDEPALEIVHWPREVPGDKPAPIDALLVSTTLGLGRLVICQIPLGPFDEDPRSRVLLSNVIDYLSSRPEPTPPPSQRPPRKNPAGLTTVPTIQFP